MLYYHGKGSNRQRGILSSTIYEIDKSQQGNYLPEVVLHTKSQNIYMDHELKSKFSMTSIKYCRK